MRLLLVDDEPLTTASLKEHINWRELGVDDVQVACNGLQAMELIPHFKPNVILSDVRMPRMNGIELATQVKETYPNIKFIFLSGYSDKEYLKAAIHLKAIRYVEKPVKLNELSEAIIESVSVCEMETASREIMQRSIKQRVLQRILSPEKAAENKVDWEDELELFLIGPFAPFSIRIMEQSETKTNYSEKAIELVSAWIRSQSRETELCEAVDSHTLLYLSKSYIDQAATAAQWLERLDRQFGPDLTFSIGMGGAAEGLDHIRSACRSALEAVNALFYDGQGLAFHTALTPASEHPPLLTEEVCRDYRTLLRNDDPAGAIHLLHQLMANAQNQRSSDISSVTNAFFRLLMILHEFAVERGITLTNDSQHQEPFIWQEIARLPTLANVCDYVEGNIQAVFSIWKEQSAVSAKISNVLVYIREHYSDAELSTRIISERTYLSLSYMCVLFKKETGSTVNEYLTEFRLVKAKELLKKQHLKLYEVASMVGFNDANYFSFIFKKLNGISPSEFRERERA